MLTIQKKAFSTKIFKSKPNPSKDATSPSKTRRISDKVKSPKETRKELSSREFYLANLVLTQWRAFVQIQRRIHSSQMHHHQTQLKHAFRTWKSKCTKKKSIWRESIRAQVHHRYLVLTSVFMNWRCHYHDAIIMKEKMNLAKEHADSYPLGAAMNQWKKYMQCRSIKQKQDKYALLLYCKFKFTKFFYIWKQALTMTLKRQCMAQSADTFHSLYVCGNRFEIWQQSFTKRKNQKIHIKNAFNWYLVQLMGKCFAKWRDRYDSCFKRSALDGISYMHLPFNFRTCSSTL